MHQYLACVRGLTTACMESMERAIEAGSLSDPQGTPRSVAAPRSHLLECNRSPATYFIMQKDGFGCLHLGRRRSGVQGMISVSDKVLWITLTSRSCLPTSGSAGMLSGIIWTFALGPVLLRNHVFARTRTGLLGLRVAMLGHFWTCPFPCAACSACCASGWAATSCPRTQDAGFVCQDKIGCLQCASRVS